MFRAPQWHGATQTHFPPTRPRKSAWCCDITNVISPHVLPTHCKQSYHAIPPVSPLTSDTPRLHRHVRMALRHHERNFATRSAHTLEAIISHDTANHPAHQRHAEFTPACFALPARRHANALSTKTAQVRMALRHQGRISPHGLPTH